MGWSGFFKGFSAVVVAIGMLLGGGYIAFQFLVAQFTASPPRPTFPNDKPATAAKPPAPAKPSPAPAPASPAPVAATPSPSPSPAPSPSPTNQRARITLGDGLNVRQAPSADAERVEGVDYNEEVTVLETSPDQGWVKVRVERSGVEGWIKSGYTEPISPKPVQ